MALAFCPQCGTKLPEGVRFCPNCGNALGAPASGAASSPPAYQATPPPPPPAFPTPPPPVPRAAADRERQNPSAGDRRDEPQEEGLGGLAKRWLKTQVNVTLDPHQGRRNEREANRLEDRMRDRVHDNANRAAYEALMPQGWKDKIEGLERQKQEQEVAREQRRRAEHEARPRADTYIRFSGAVAGEFRQPVPVSVSRPEEPGEPLRIELDPLGPVPVGGHAFLGLWFGVPRYAGQGTYELRFYEPRDDWDGTMFQLMVDTTDEPLYWTTDYGVGVVTVGPDERTFTIQLATEDSGSRHIDIQAVVTLPEVTEQA